MKLGEKFTHTNLSLFFICLLVGFTVILAQSMVPSYLTESLSLAVASILILLFLRNLIITKKLSFNRMVLVGLAAIVVIYLIMAKFSVSWFISLRSLFYVSAFLVVVFVMHYLDIDGKTIVNLFKYLVFVGLIVIVVGYYYYLFIDKDRFSSVFNNPNILASFLLLILPISYYLRQIHKSNIFWNLQLVIFISALILTFSRGGLLSFFLTTLIFSFLFKDKLLNSVGIRYFKLQKIMPIVLSFLAFFVLWLFPLISLRHSNLYANIFGRFSYNLSLRGRIEFLQAGYRIFKDNVLKGTGPGTYQVVLSAYQVSPVGYSIYPHNIIIELLSEFGLIGIILLTIVVSFIFGVAKKLIRENYFSHFYFIFFGFLSFLLNMLFEVSWHNAGLFFIWALYIGLLTHLFKSDTTKNTIKDLAGKRLIIACLVCLVAIFWFSQNAFKSYWYNYYLEAGKFYLESNQFGPARNSIEKTFTFFANEENTFQTALVNYVIYSKTSKIELLDTAEKFINKSLDYNFYQAKAYDLRGLIQTAKEDFVGAEESFRRAISLDKFNNPDYYINLAQLYYSQNRHEEAVKTLTTFLDYYPFEIIEARRTSGYFIERLSQVYYALALIYKNVGDVDKERHYLIQALKVDKYNVGARRELNRLNFNI